VRQFHLQVLLVVHLEHVEVLLDGSFLSHPVVLRKLQWSGADGGPIVRGQEDSVDAERLGEVVGVRDEVGQTPVDGGAAPSIHQQIPVPNMPTVERERPHSTG